MVAIGNTFISGIVTGASYALLALGLNLIFGMTGMLNFAHGEYLMLAMYACYFIFTVLGIHPYLAIPLVFVLMFLLGVLTYVIVMRYTLRATQMSQLLAFVGIGMILQSIASIAWSSDPKMLHAPRLFVSIGLGPFTVSMQKLTSFAIALFAISGIFVFLANTRVGKAMRALSQDRIACQLMGINVNVIYIYLFGLGIGCCGLAGALLIPSQPVYPTIGLGFVLICFVVVILGGIGNMLGTLLAGLIIGLVEAYTCYYLGSALKDAIYLLVMVGILMWRPKGLFGTVSRLPVPRRRR
jgi:branched-chain amino acid transport system permease protein